MSYGRSRWSVARELVRVAWGVMTGRERREVALTLIESPDPPVRQGPYMTADPPLKLEEISLPVRRAAPRRPKARPENRAASVLTGKGSKRAGPYSDRFTRFCNIVLATVMASGLLYSVYLGLGRGTTASGARRAAEEHGITGIVNIERECMFDPYSPCHDDGRSVGYGIEYRGEGWPFWTSYDVVCCEPWTGACRMQ